MLRNLIAAIAVCSLVASGSAQVVKPPMTVPKFVEAFRAIEKETRAKSNAIVEKASAADESAKTEVARAKIWKEANAEIETITAPAVRKVFDLAKPNAAEKAACEALVWVVRHQSNGELGLAAVALLKEHHLVRKETIELAKSMKQSASGWVEGLLRAQRAAADLPEDQAWRVDLALAMCLQNQAGIPSWTESEAERFENNFGKTRVAEMKKYDPLKLEAEATALFKEIGEKYPKQELVPGLTVAAFAKTSIFEIEHLSVGKVAPDIAGEDLDGAKFKLSDYRGKAVMLSFWGSWCGPCMSLVPHERELVAKYAGMPFALIGVNSDEDKVKLKPVLETNKIVWRSFWCGPKGPEGPIPLAWNINGWTTIYLIDHTGVIRSKTAMGTTLEAKIEKLVAEAEKALPKK